MFLVLLWDRPFPSPDFYSFAQASQDISHAQRTQSKYPPGLSFLLIPFLPWGTNAQATTAQVINVLSALGFASSLFTLCRHLKVPASSVCIALTLFNRYTIQATLSGTAHIPFLFLSTACLVCALRGRWSLAYALAGASTLFRYNGVIFPVLVGLWHFASLHQKGDALPLGRRLAIPTAGTLASLIPVGLWLTMGTQSALGTYAEEIAMRGVAGVKALLYLPATLMTSFLDTYASQALRSAPAREQFLSGLPLLGPFILGLRGLFALFRLNRNLTLWLLATLVGWGIVHGGFPEVGGLFFYAIQVTWILWLLVLYGFWKQNSRASLLLLALPLLLILRNEPRTLLLVTAVVLVIILTEIPSRRTLPGKGILSSVIAVTAGIIGVLTAQATIYNVNYRPLIPRLLQFAKSNPRVLVSYPLWLQLRAHGWDTSPLVPENLVDGNNPKGSFRDLGIRFVAVGDWEVKNRHSQEFWQEHEFFLGKEYKTSLKPYQLIVQAYEERGFALFQSLSFRKVQISIFRPLDDEDSPNTEDAKR